VETLVLKYQAMMQALATLQEALQLLRKPETQMYYKSFRDSAIQRFEYCIDTFWKYLKLYLQEKKGLVINSASPSPRDIMREALAARIIDLMEAQILLASITDRNQTSHSYNEKTAEDIVQDLPAVYEIMEQVLNRLMP
jgi:nucleotidyltransferase substrate binding protein (TIGR01987 family)